MPAQPQADSLSPFACGALSVPRKNLALAEVAARRMDYSTLGFVQFLSPTIAFVLGVTVFGERLSTAQLVSFVLIWAAIALFSADLLRSRSAGKPPA